jgi:hypothetical protein
MSLQSKQIDELLKGPCGALMNELASVGVTSSVVISPEAGILMGPEGAERLTLRRTHLYGLTADEWFHLASEGGDSEIAPCCGSIGQLRDLLRELMTFQSPDDIGFRWALGQETLLVIQGDGDGHELGNTKQFPLLHRALEGISEELRQRDEKKLTTPPVVD